MFSSALPSLYIITHTALSLPFITELINTRRAWPKLSHAAIDIIVRETDGGRGGGKEEGWGYLVARRDDRDVISFAVAASIYM